MELTSSYVDSLAPNTSAIQNGKALAKGKFLKLFIAKDDSLLFGECAGSGSRPYACSVDFIDKANPVARCTCPSRQIPCKHAIGLMYAYVNGNKFEETEIPEDILEKRRKLEQRQENKQEKAKKSKEEAKAASLKKPSKAQITTATKRIDTQLEGLHIADKLLKNIIQTGLASIDAKTAKTLSEQIQQLGNYYISGIQTAFEELLLFINDDDKEYTKSIAKLLYLQSLLKKAREHLEGKKNHPENITQLNVSSAIEELIGHVWKLDELLTYNQYIHDAEVVQLSFYSYADFARKEFVDEGYYLCLNNGLIFTKKNFRPFKALKYLKEDDTIFNVLKIEELYIYPGDLNPRGRWEGYNFRGLCENDFSKIKSFASNDFSDITKKIKNQIKNALSDKNPIVLLHISDLKLFRNESEEEIIQVWDKFGNKQILTDAGYVQQSTINVLKRLDRNLLKDSALLVMYETNLDTGLLTAKPLSIITDSAITRLCY